MQLKSYLVLIGLFQINCVKSLNILGLFPHPGRSHMDVFSPLMEGLAERGHKVTVVSHFSPKKPHPNYNEIHLTNRDRSVTQVSINQLTGTRLDQYAMTFILGYVAQEFCDSGLQSPELQELLTTDQQFDVIIAEFFNTDCFLGFVDKFNAPLIGFHSSTLMPWTSARFGNPTHSAYIPNNLMQFSDRMSFLERTENTVQNIFQQFFFDYYVTNNDDYYVKKYIGEDVGPVRDIFFNSSLMLVNSHFSLNLPRPWVPNVIEVGGIHIGQPNPLPHNLEKWMNESAEGVIYFSLGSMIKGTTFPEDKRQAFLKAFGRLSHRVLWKWENETMPGKPDNVMIQKWMPQFDILCHPKVKAFISHGGLLGTTEAVHCGVPVIVMPQFGDQHTNAKALEASGGGVILQLREATEETVYKALKKVLSSDFNQKAKELSARFRDRPLPPLETAIYWVEYVARHRGAPHMRTAAVDMPFYQYYLLDVFGFLLLIIAAITYINLKICKFLFRKIIDSLSNNKVKTS